MHRVNCWNISVVTPPVLRDSDLNNYKSSKIPYLNYFCAKKSSNLSALHTLTTHTLLKCELSKYARR